MREGAGLRASYDRVAGRYAAEFAAELDHKPFDRELLDRFAAGCGGAGWLVDLGSGPSQVGAYVAARAGVPLVSVDLSFGMLRAARRLRAEALCVQADMRALPFADASIASVVAFYSVIHVPQAEVAAPLGEVHRVLAAGGRLAVAVHLGDEVVHAEEMLGEPVAIDFHFYDSDELVAQLEVAGFDVDERHEREPYAPGVEAQTRRAYLVARRR